MACDAHRAAANRTTTNRSGGGAASRRTTTPSSAPWAKTSGAVNAHMPDDAHRPLSTATRIAAHPARIGSTSDQVTGTAAGP